ncbi:autophagy-related protein 16-like [Cornus florida]|uniref:autophagy-related protein 16-like n=1 Tax=Cornus florida TaxID=4283 RepID=UPI00289B4E6A|nr:autophagy-related protein 16-like [Cornus florida]
MTQLVRLQTNTMEDSNMEEVEEEEANNLSSPPRKKIKTILFGLDPPHHKIKAHEGGCSPISFLNNSHALDPHVHGFENVSKQAGGIPYQRHEPLLSNDVGQHDTGETSALISSESLIPNLVQHKIKAHEGRCSSISFLNNSHTLISGGKDSTIKLWDTSNGTLTRTLQGFRGSVYDLAISSDDTLLVAALTSRNLCVWDVNSGQICRTLVSRHRQKVCAVDIDKVCSRYIISGDNDHTITFWDLQKDYPICSMYISSPCNAICFTTNENKFCSGHSDGRIRFSNTERYVMLCDREIALHTQPVTSICPFRCGNVVLSSGRDNLHNLVDVRTMQVCGKFKIKGNKVASNWSRSCVSPDENFVVVGSADGSIYVWSLKMGRMVSTVKEHGAPVLACSWSGLGRPLASTDDDGTICIWS